MDSLNEKFFNFEGNNWFKRHRKIMQNEKCYDDGYTAKVIKIIKKLKKLYNVSKELAVHVLKKYI
tara:strand:+ start:327 stop:521 length:195 start_codon:yes stop_codon:yes gene_type:complete